VLHKGFTGQLKIPRLIYKQLNYVVTQQDKIKLFSIILIQIFLSLLDVLGVAIIGLVSALAISGIQSKSSSQGVSKIIDLIHIQNLSFQAQVGSLSVLAVLVLLSRTLISIYFIRRIYRFFSYKSAELSADLIMKVLSQNLLKVREKTTQDTLYSVTHGVNALMMGTFANAANLVSDFSILIFIIAALVVVDPIIAISTALMFFFISILINRIVNTRAQFLGKADAGLQVESNSKITEVLASYRELFVQNRLFYYSNEIRNLRVKLAKYQAEFTFMPNINKYIVETTVIVGALIVAGIQFSLKDAANAFATLSIFLVAATRLAPSLLRVQQGSMLIRNSFGAASTTVGLIQTLNNLPSRQIRESKQNFNYINFTGNISISNVSLTYPSKQDPAISDISMEISAGEFIAVVGSSGAGKTTLIDTLLGVLEPSTGLIKISELSPVECITKWPGAISYVPQDINIFDGTIRTNVALGYPKEIATDEMVWKAVNFAELGDVVSELPNGIDTEIGERGIKLSGGQRQRLGIARALFSKPQLLVLDEATSSLDSETELKISKAIQNLKGKVTVVIIAHRLSTVRKADHVYYLEDGKIKAFGSFEEVRKISPEFDKQAKLLGL
jgi:ABC-type multidrug transport system fused ATPase/permease subunit